MKLPFLLKHTEVKSSWAWPSCHQPRTLSFRANNNHQIFKTINSAYLDPNSDVIETPDSFFTNSSESPSFSTSSEDSGDPVEMVIRGLRSERLFFEPEETSSILEAKGIGLDFEDVSKLPFKESVVLSMDSREPYLDFLISMEEMVEAHGVKDWEGLEELLSWYLKVNGKSNHGYIVCAFVDLLVGLASNAAAPSSSCQADRSPSSPLSFYTSSSSSSFSTPCVSCLEPEEEVEEDMETPTCSSLQGKEEIKDETHDASSSNVLI